MAPSLPRVATSSTLWRAARVITTRLPDSTESEVALILSTLPPHFLEDCLRASFHQQPRHLFAKLLALVECTGQTLLYLLLAIDGGDACFHNHFAALYSSPCPDGNLTTALQRGEQCALGNNCGSRFRIIQLGQKVAGLIVAEPRFHRDGALTYSGHEHFRRESLRDSLAQSQAIQTCLGQNDGVVLPVAHLAKSGVHIATQFANIKIRAQTQKLRSTAQATRPHTRARPQIFQR